MQDRLKALATALTAPGCSSAELKVENRSLVLLAALAVTVGMVFGGLGGIFWQTRSTTTAVRLDAGAQDDFVVSVAEAYALDGDIGLARERLARLYWPDISYRVEKLALAYAPQRDPIAVQLAELAIAFGSTDQTLIALNIHPMPGNIALLSVALPQAIPVPTEPPTAAPTRASRSAAATPENGDSVVLAAQLAAGVALKPSPGPNQPAVSAQSAPPAQTGAVPSTSIALLIEPTPAPASGTKATPKATPKPKGPAVPAVPIRQPIVSSMPVKIPNSAGMPDASIPLTARPSGCTPASQMPAVVNQTIALCPGQTYQPFTLNGTNITLYADRARGAVVQSTPHKFGITAQGTNISIVGVTVVAATDPGDLNTWLCMYDACGYKNWSGPGGAAYGGGILLDHTTSGSVVNSTVSGGTIGVAAVGGSNDKIANNNLSNLNGWGVFLSSTHQEYIVGNTLDHVTRPCIDPEGNYVQSGCESSGLAAIQVDSVVIASNQCEQSANCYYASGDGGHGSNNNKFFNNYCVGASANCFEVTFSQGNQFDYNTATGQCVYPFWIGGSIVQFGSHNNWDCKFSAAQALQQSQQDTKTSPTAIQGF